MGDRNAEKTVSVLPVANPYVFQEENHFEVRPARQADLKTRIDGKMIMEDAIPFTANIAAQKGYTTRELEAAQEYLSRRDRRKNPPGSFDKAGRFYAAERTTRVEKVRSPSRFYPYSEMTAARSADHVAEVFDVRPIAVKRLAKAIEAETAAQAGTAHQRLEIIQEIDRMLKTILPERKAT